VKARKKLLLSVFSRYHTEKACGEQMKAKTLWISVYGAVLLWSAINPKDYLTWALEVAPAVLGAGVLMATRRSFPLTPLTSFLILVHCIILLVGGHYTYAEVPLFDWLAEVFGWQRNNYDKLGHFAQGFIPAIIAREILIRKNVVATPAWRNFFIVCFCLGFSAFYELIEWWVALLSHEAADSFLGTQGYVWDTQSDMAWALFGASLCLVLLGRVHDMQLDRQGLRIPKT
jgi:putative membrane protein